MIEEEWTRTSHPIEPLGMAEVNVTVTENPVVVRLLGPSGETIREWRERPTFGF